MKKYKVDLLYNEILRLDGNVHDEVQKIIDIAKKEQSIGFDWPILNEVIRKSEEIGTLSWSYKQISSCDYCGKKPDYQRYARSSKFHSKGSKNYDKPIYYSGIKFNEGMVSIQGSGDMCRECCDGHGVVEKMVKYIIENDLKIEIRTNEFSPTKYKKDDVRICYACDEKMYESEMIKEPTLMGRGSYPGTCPKCNATQSLFGSSHKTTNEFRHLLNPAFE